MSEWSRVALHASLRIFIGGIAVVTVGVFTIATAAAFAAEPNTIDVDDDGHYERLPMEPANVKRVFLGFRLTTVAPGSVYERAGLRSGDLLKSMNGKPVVEPDDLKELPKILDRDKKVELKIERGDKRMTLRYSVQVVKKVTPAKKTAAKKTPVKKVAKSKTSSAKRAASSSAAKKAPKKKTIEKTKKKVKTAADMDRLRDNEMGDLGDEMPMHHKIQNAYSRFLTGFIHFN